MSKLNSKTIQLPADAHCIKIDLSMSNDDNTVIKYKLISTGDKLHFHVIKGVFCIDSILERDNNKHKKFNSYISLRPQVGTAVFLFEMWSYKDLVDIVNKL